MNMFFSRTARAAITFTLLGVAGAAQAQVVVSEAWARATVPQQRSSAAFMRLTAPTDVRLVSVQSSVAEVVELHEMAMDGNVMKMRAVTGGLEMPAGKAVELTPGGYHVMLMGLTRQLKDGDNVPLTLIFESKDKGRQTVDVSAAVRPLGVAATFGRLFTVTYRAPFARMLVFTMAASSDPAVAIAATSFGPLVAA